MQNKNYNLEIQFDNGLSNSYKQKVYDYLKRNLTKGIDGCWYSKNFLDPIGDIMGVACDLMEDRTVLKYIKKMHFNNLVKNTYDDGLKAYAKEISEARRI